jgi:hypothetical protein
VGHLSWCDPAHRTILAGAYPGVRHSGAPVTLTTGVLGHDVLRISLLQEIEDARPHETVGECLRLITYNEALDDQDWSRLWWVRVDGTARIVDDEQERADQIDRLCEKYVQYRENPPAGPITWVNIETVTGWAYQG